MECSALHSSTSSVWSAWECMLQLCMVRGIRIFVRAGSIVSSTCISLEPSIVRVWISRLADSCWISSISSSLVCSSATSSQASWLTPSNNSVVSRIWLHLMRITRVIFVASTERHFREMARFWIRVIELWPTRICRFTTTDTIDSTISTTSICSGRRTNLTIRDWNTRSWIRLKIKIFHGFPRTREIKRRRVRKMLRTSKCRPTKYSNLLTRLNSCLGNQQQADLEFWSLTSDTIIYVKNSRSKLLH